jgi:hypothetical protein
MGTANDKILGNSNKKTPFFGILHNLTHNWISVPWLTGSLPSVTDSQARLLGQTRACQMMC